MQLMPFVSIVLLFALPAGAGSAEWCKNIKNAVISVERGAGGKWVQAEFLVEEDVFNRSVYKTGAIHEYEEAEEITFRFYQAFDIRFWLGRGGKSLPFVKGGRPFIFWGGKEDRYVRLLVLAEVSTDFDLVDSVAMEVIDLGGADGNGPPRNLIGGIKIPLAQSD